MAGQEDGDENDVRQQQAPAYKRIINGLTAAIDARKLAPGSSLPSERQLCVDFGVTRATVARALREMEHAGLIERRQGQGTFVAMPRASKPVSSTVVCILPSLRSPFVTGIFVGIESAARAAGHHIVIANSRGDAALEAELLEHARRTAEGVVLWPLSEATNAPLIARLAAAGFPLVSLDRVLPGVSVDAVVADNHAAGFLLTSYLLDQGHERIAFVRDELLASSVKDRLLGYQQAFAERGKAAQPGWISTTPYTPGTPREQRQNCVARLLAQRPSPTAFIAVNAAVLTTLIQDLTHFGVHIPDDVVLATTDNTEGDGLLRLATASIMFDCFAMGEQAIHLLLNRQRLGTALAPRQIVVPVKLHTEGAISVRIARSAAQVQ